MEAMERLTLSDRPSRHAKQQATYNIARIVGLTSRELAQCSDPARIIAKNNEAGRQKQPPVVQTKEQRAVQHFKKLKRSGYFFSNSDETKKDPPSLEKLLEMSLEELEEDDLTDKKCQLHDPEAEKCFPVDFTGKERLYDWGKRMLKSIALKGAVDEDTCSKNIDRINEEQVVTNIDIAGMMLQKKLLESELFQMAATGDIDGILKEIIRTTRITERVNANGEIYKECDPGCYCMTPFLPISSCLKYPLNPLHVAAKFNQHKFLKALLLDYEKHLERLAPGNNIASHCKTILFKWCKSVGTDARFIPIDIAVWEDSFECVKVFLGDGIHAKHLLDQENKDRAFPADSFICSHESFVKHTDPLICKMAWNNRLKDLDATFLREWFSNTPREYLISAINNTICSGSEESFEVLYRHESSLIDENTIDISHREKCGRHFDMNSQRLTAEMRRTVFQYACVYWDPKRVFGMSMKTLHTKDAYGYTALIDCLRFDEEYWISRAIRAFLPIADKEEMFAAFHHLVAFNKNHLAMEMLEKMLGMYKLFDVRHKIDADYGVPEYVVLPLCDVLATTGDLRMFSNIITLYKESKIPMCAKMARADAIQCLQWIQHHTHTLSDQLRLALILKMIPRAPVTDVKWLENLRMNIVRSRRDPLAEYVLKTHNRPQLCDIMPIHPWLDVMKQSRKIVAQWNGTVEYENGIEFLKDRRKSFGVQEMKPSIGNNAPKLVGILKKRS